MNGTEQMERSTERAVLSKKDAKNSRWRMNVDAEMSVETMLNALFGSWERNWGCRGLLK